MESNILRSQVFQAFITNPTVENVQILKHFLNVQIEKICSSNQENLVLTAIFTVIGDIDVR